ncbi:tetratricopeptide repeat protein [Xanthobacter agilis]|uniref:Tetratricopeptide (TPR) repeat protein n=1 Tax=Xanthobacter agilis TaxID=47492 RepID=A0ABU0L9V1_XANAG|nr:hypothetical protein [Xanthobacter agilis]MDQ0503919.1 tetratricopeptide (TPR) repeat protein [Xanthobacter agilis]
MTEGNAGNSLPINDPSTAEAPACAACEESAATVPPEPESGAAASEDTSDGDPSSEWEREVRAALARVLASADLCTSPRLAAFLRYVVEATLAGRAEQIKGYTIAVEALGRAPTFDPQADPIVRVEATRLRRALQNYYNTIGLADPLLIHIPKGGYVPQFEDRRASAPAAPPPEPVLPPEPQAGAEPGAVELDPPPPVRRKLGAVRLAAAAAVAGVLLTGTAFRLMDNLDLPAPVQAWLGARPSMADRVRLPIIEVGNLEASDGRGPSRGDLHGIEERLRDSFAQFDFVEVRAGSPHGDVAARECSARRPRSVFSLGGLAEAREDGTYALLVHLTDRCEGIIVWSHAIEGLRSTTPGDAEQRVVGEVAAALLESYGVVSVRARSQALAHAPASGFGCIAEAFAVLRNDGSASSAVPRACLTQLVNRDGEFALGHAVRAAAMLDEGMGDPVASLPPERVAEMLHEAELAVDLAPASAYAARTLALVQLFVGETEAASATAEQALRLNPLDHDIAASMGMVFIGAGRVAEGETLLLSARTHGAARSPLQETYLAIAAFLRDDPFSAQALVPQLRMHPNPGNRLALALALHALDRDSDEREAVRSLAHLEGGGPEAVRRMVRHLLPAPVASERALTALESAGLSQEAATGKRPRG